MSAGGRARSELPDPGRTRTVLDHLVVAGPDLAQAVRHVEGVLGVRAVAGGRHPGAGTRNALIGLAGGAYLEIVAPDPEQPDPGLPRWFGIDGLQGPRLVTWCVRARSRTDAAPLAREAVALLGPVLEGGRERTDGVRLRWRVTDPRADRRGGVLPFLIDWGASEHPSVGLAPACTLVALRGWHPDADEVGAVASTLGFPVAFEPGPIPRLEAALNTPRGVVTLG